MAKKAKPFFPQQADLKCKDCGSLKFSVHVEVYPNGAIHAVELECSGCAIDQIPLVKDEIGSEYITTTLDEDDHG